MSFQPVLPQGMENFRDVFASSTGSPLPEVSVPGVKSIRDSGFLKLGFGFAIEDQMGRLFLVPHIDKAENNVVSGELGIPSETVKGKFVEEKLVAVEGIASCLVRCLAEEQDIDLRQAPEDARLMLTRISPIVVIDWVMSHLRPGDDSENDYSDSTFGLLTMLKANPAMAEFIAVHAKDTEEAETGFFKPLTAIRKHLTEGRPHRASFGEVFDLHLLHAPNKPEESWKSIVIPNVLDDETGEWRELKFQIPTMQETAEG